MQKYVKMDPSDLFCLRYVSYTSVFLSEGTEGEIIYFSKASFPHIFGSIFLAPNFSLGTSHSLFFFFFSVE